MTDLITQSGMKYDVVVIVYNKFLYTISYKAAMIEVKCADTLKESSAYLNLWNIDPCIEPSFFF